MPWLQDDGEEDEFSQLEEEDGESDGTAEEIEEVIVTERPGASMTTSLPAPARSDSRKKSPAKSKPPLRAKAKPKKTAQSKKSTKKGMKKIAKKAAKKPARKTRRGRR